MSTIITHNGQTIRILAAHETPAAQCAAGDFFIRQDDRGFWVSNWDGNQAWDTDLKPIATLDEAIDWAKEVAENVQDED